MNGMDALCELRTDQSAVPRAVWIVDGSDERAAYWDALPSFADRQLHAVVEIGEKDIPEALDFRCVVGLTVHISGERGAGRLRRLHQAAIEAKARVVITSIAEQDNIELLTHGLAK